MNCEEEPTGSARGQDCVTGTRWGQWPPHPQPWPPLTDVLWDKGHEAAAAASRVDSCDVQHVGYHGEHLDVWDGAAGGVWCWLEAGLALAMGGHSEPGHGWAL